MLADNPSLPATSRYLHHALTNASTTYIARYMIFQYRRDGARQVLTSAVRRPIVSLPVAKEMVRLWDLERGHSRHATNSPFSAASGSSTPTTPCTPQRQRTTAPALEVTQLPRRLFRRKPAEGQPAIDPFITWLFTHWDFDLKRKGHRPLVYSVINQNYELVEFLLRRGADPRNSDEFAVRAAVQKKDLRMVRLLVEPFEDESNEQPDDSLPLPSPRSRKRPRAEEATPKRKDRVPINQTHVQLALEHGTPEIVDYFVHEKGESSVCHQPAFECSRTRYTVARSNLV
jgi:hypothetical protein